MSWRTRRHHIGLALTALPGLLVSPTQRRLLAEMRQFSRTLPQVMAQPLPQAQAQLTPGVQTSEVLETSEVYRRRHLADFAALLDRRSPLGLCLRRSLIRYHFLRRANVPLSLYFGAKFVEGQADRKITGHAWTVLAGQPYHEAAADWQGFTVMLRWPEEP